MSEIQRVVKETQPLVITKSDSSVYPSYSNLIIPYRVTCRRRYHHDGIRQNKQFLHEVATQEALQRKALDGVRVHRIFCNPMLSPPSTEEIIHLTINEKRRVESILRN